MLECSLVLYSRTRTDDYRWIFGNREVDSISEQLLSEYVAFEKNRETYLTENYLFFKSIHTGCLLYSFVDTKNTDLSGRKIYGLVGCFFVEHNADFVTSILPQSICYFRHSDFFHDIYQLCSETDERVIRLMSIDLNHIYDVAYSCDEYQIIRRDFPNLELQNYSFPKTKKGAFTKGSVAPKTPTVPISDSAPVFVAKDSIDVTNAQTNSHISEKTPKAPPSSMITKKIYLGQKQHKKLFSGSLFSSSTKADEIISRYNVQIKDFKEYVEIIGESEKVLAAENAIKSFSM